MGKKIHNPPPPAEDDDCLLLAGDSLPKKPSGAPPGQPDEWGDGPQFVPDTDT